MKHALALAFPLLIAVPAHAGQAAGHYVTVDDNSGEPRAVVELVENEAGELEGYARGTFVAGQEATCSRCDGEMKDAPMIGLRILRGLERDDKPGRSATHWKGGRITDPDNGKTYKSKLRFADDYSSVKVRGYIGTPALGRSQEWRRATPDDIAAANALAVAAGLDPIVLSSPLVESSVSN